MKKLFLYLLLIAGIVACSKDDNSTPPPAPGPSESLDFIADGVPGLSGTTLTVPDPQKESTAEIELKGVTGEPTATVDPVSKSWLSADIRKEIGSKAEAQADTTWIVVIGSKEYKGNEGRSGYVTVKSGADELTFSVVQTGRGKRVRMVVVNEGQFTRGTAALSAITFDGTTTFDIFRDVNNRPIGDVAQSLTYINGKYFVAMNNSKKVEVIEPQTFRSIATINYEQDGSPRFVAPISDTTAIVSDLNAQLVRIDTKNYKVIEHIDISASGAMQVEKMTVIGKKLFCAALGAGIGVYDTDGPITGASMRIVEGLEGSIMKTCKLLTDKNDKLWVFTTGSGKALLNRIDPATEKVDKVVEIPYIAKGDEAYTEGCITGTAWFTRWDTDRNRNRLYFYMNELINAERGTVIGAVFTLDVDKDAIDPKPYRELPGLGMMYGMGISPDGNVFLCDCMDYTAQRGFLREYRADGSVDSRRVGVYPRMVHFTEYDE